MVDSRYVQQPLSAGKKMWQSGLDAGPVFGTLRFLVWRFGGDWPAGNEGRNEWMDGWWCRVLLPLSWLWG
jgi:hypothetical protein